MRIMSPYPFLRSYMAEFCQFIERVKMALPKDD